jgi:hypothetical protein
VSAGRTPDFIFIQLSRDDRKMLAEQGL